MSKWDKSAWIAKPGEGDQVSFPIKRSLISSRLQGGKGVAVEIKEERRAQDFSKLPVVLDLGLHGRALRLLYLVDKGCDLAVGEGLQDEGVGQGQTIVEGLIIAYAAANDEAAGRGSHKLVDGLDAAFAHVVRG